MDFEGFSPEMTNFFAGIAFDNTASFFHNNHKIYTQHVLRPMQVFAMALSPVILDIDDGLSTRLGRVVSRLRRDTRFVKDKRLYRDHMWLSFRPEGMRIGEGCSFYFEMGLEEVAWGIGFYQATPSQMRAIRKRIAAMPQVFTKIIKNKKLREYTLGGPDYKRLPPESEGAQKAVYPWLIKKSFYFEYSRSLDKRAYEPELLDEVKQGFYALAPLYHFVKESLDGQAEDDG
jgi:uncharacterized protein (TIGR02453 family)